MTTETPLAVYEGYFTVYPDRIVLASDWTSQIQDSSIEITFPGEDFIWIWNETDVLNSDDCYYLHEQLCNLIHIRDRVFIYDDLDDNLHKERSELGAIINQGWIEACESPIVYLKAVIKGYYLEKLHSAIEELNQRDW